MSSYARKQATKSSGSNNNGSTKEERTAAHIIGSAIKQAFMVPEGDSKDTPGLAAMAIAFAGDDLKYPIGEGLFEIAKALNRIAEAIEDGEE